ncbi:hypothetical protein ACFV4K_29015 [Nocardia sp. NPDC059764]|uniref:hypothetical protein n=1 Tax=Nocardia sp. NPDC059764 TaxID=3346939 RepID=UPI0036529CE0
MSFSPPSDPMYSTVYSDWVRASDPDAVAVAEDLVAYLGKGFQGADTPGGFIDRVVDRRVTMLPESHRPWVWDMVGHWFAAYIPLVAWESRCRKAASSACGRARAAERKHSLPVPVDYHPDSWSAVTSIMGDRGETDCLPEFFTDADVPEGRTLAWTLLSYAPLPPGVTTSPLGSKDGMMGYRITQSGEGWCGYALEGIDGRQARFAGGRGAGEP